MPGEYILEMEGIVKEFPGVRALGGVDFKVRKGEVHALVGENGAGKSTLMKILGGVYSKDAGVIRVHGREVELQGPRHAAELGIGMIHQEFNLVPGLTVAENIFLDRMPSGRLGFVDYGEMFERAAEVLRSLEAPIDPRARVADLTVAGQQIVEIAKALTLDADILVMDEPSAALVSAEVEKLFRMIRSLKARGVSVIYISHKLDEIFQIADRITVLRDGLKVGESDIRDTTKQEIVRLMVGRELSNMFPKEEVPRGEEILRVEGLSMPGAFTDVSFSLSRGEILGIVGLMGAGHTDLARALFGVVKPTAGRIVVRGQEVRIGSPREAIARGFGWVTENRKEEGLVLVMSVARNTTLASLDQVSNAGFVSDRSERTVVDRFIQALGIKTPSVDQKVMYLSGGNQQKVVLAKWLMTSPDIIIFSEPTRGIDVGAKAEIYRLMNDLAREGKAIILISSETPEVLGMSDRILVMARGRVVKEFKRGEATQQDLMYYATGGKGGDEDVGS